MTITVFTLPECVQCDSTKRMLDRAGVEYSTIDLSQDDESMAKVRSLGYQSAPIVYIDENRHWSGFRMERLKNIIAELDAEKGKQ